MNTPNEQARLDTLTTLSIKVHNLLNKLTALNQDPTRKWTWNREAMTIIHQLRSLATTNLPLLRSNLDAALTFPSAALTNPTLFLGSKPNFETFTRTPSWFDTMGFNTYTTPYTFSSTWDHFPISATILVPKTLDTTSKPVKIVFFFHGGGFCTGAGDFVSWYSASSLAHAKAANAVIIAPDYPLGPEASYLEISMSIREFLRWYGEDGCFEAGFAGWRAWLASVSGQPGLEGCLKGGENSVLVEGESAGGHAAVTALFANAEVGGVGVRIDVVFLRYPMIRHYARELTGSVNYMGVEFEKGQVVERAEAIKTAVEELERMGLLATRSWDHPPRGMSGAFLLSITGMWKGMFQRHAGKGNDIDAKMDGLERAVAYAGKVDENRLPAVVVYHGEKDTNCPVSDTREFCELLEKNYPKYVNGENIFLETVTRLEAQLTWNVEKKELERTAVTDVAHAFDYQLDRNKEKFLQDAFEHIDKFWGQAK
ncbi:alpha/beta-hydrolase [Plenodomus tracheiphilus IPT5]|uniref:Alpha/beta-hydrolase n=1 Tax=Plenodomus tracheiphilus IPT5 TaxID=1408161 RepID=A0A6A7BAX6_9PLEO|nr:alpha/beta-hydrolase [Plenodomus tracheiphilus IPT5]